MIAPAQGQGKVQGLFSKSHVIDNFPKVPPMRRPRIPSHSRAALPRVQPEGVAIAGNSSPDFHAKLPLTQFRAVHSSALYCAVHDLRSYSQSGSERERLITIIRMGVELWKEPARLVFPLFQPSLNGGGHRSLILCPHFVPPGLGIPVWSLRSQFVGGGEEGTPDRQGLNP
jgi:hypothetical protein